MKRREFVAAGMVFALGSARAQPPPLRRAAVVIGVDKVGDLPRLRAAVSGAQSVATWLQREGFDVTLFSDATSPVKANDLFAAVNALVRRGTLDQLVIYFAGHGFINSYSEFWLLSEGPDNPNEAVSLNESVALARQSGIPNVVFISDACRSRADSLRTERVRGSLIFPNTGIAPNVITDVDQFLATLVGDPSWEVPVAQSTAAFAGLYTTCFLDAFRRPDRSMVRAIDGQDVIPNNRLKPFLAREVPLRARAIHITLDQRPDSLVVSDEATYIGRVGSGERLAPNAAPAPPTIRDVASAALERVGAGGITGERQQISAAALIDLATESGFTRASDAIVQARGLHAQSSAYTGFIVQGKQLKSVAAHPAVNAWLTDRNDERRSMSVEVALHGARAASVALQFADGSGTVLAALDGYIGTVVVQDDAVSNVSYMPSYGPLSDNDANRLEQLRAAVATAAKFGVFRLEGVRQNRDGAAAQLADRIRILKGIDPTLGLYAAYAYADAGLLDKVRSVRQSMRDNLRTNLFDVIMLSRALQSELPDGVFPCCPMLSQGWGLLRVCGARLPESIVEAHNHVRPGLWTTFDASGTRIVVQALREGSVR